MTWLGHMRATSNSGRATMHEPQTLEVPRDALVGPRGLKERGSPEWCWQTLEAVRLYHSGIAHQFADVEREIVQLEAVRAWEVIPPERPFGSLDAMLRAALGLTADELRRQTAVARSAASRTQAAAEVTKKEDALPADGSVNQHNLGAQIAHPQTERATRTGISRRQQQHLDRLARQFPDLLAAVRSGRLSVHRACIEAGISEPTMTVPLDPEKMARAIRRRLNDEEIDALIEALGEVD